MAHDRTTVTDGVTVWGNTNLQALWQKLDDEVRASAYNNAVQSIANATWVALTLNTEDYDTGAMHSTAVNTSRMTVPASHAGLYLLTAQVAFDNNATGFRGVAFHKNGTGMYTQLLQPLTGTLTIAHATALVVLAVADYIEVFAHQTSGGALNTGSAASANANRLQITKLR